MQGTEEESANLIRHGFSLAEDAQGNKYYCGPFGHIIFLYENGTWYSDKGDPKLSLQEYLDWMDQRPVV